MNYIVTIRHGDKEFYFKHKQLCDAIAAIENAAETVEGFENGETTITLSVKTALISAD